MKTRQLQALMAEFLTDRLSRQDFLATFARQTWGFGLWDDREAAELAGQVSLLLAEYTGGHLPQEALRSELQGLFLGAPVLVIGNNPHSPIPMFSQENTQVLELRTIMVGA